MLMRLKVTVGMSFIGYYGNCKEISISDFKLVDTKLMTVDFQPICGSCLRDRGYRMSTSYKCQKGQAKACFTYFIVLINIMA